LGRAERLELHATGNGAAPGIAQGDLRYNFNETVPMASLVFTETEVPTAAYVLQGAELGDVAALQDETGIRVWAWTVGEPQASQLPHAAAARPHPSPSLTT
jgi:hypothetical protein